MRSAVMTMLMTQSAGCVLIGKPLYAISFSFKLFIFFFLHNIVFTRYLNMHPNVEISFSKRYLVYNDGYSHILGSKHPDALGMGILDVWPEIRGTEVGFTFHAHVHCQFLLIFC